MNDQVNFTDFVQFSIGFGQVTEASEVSEPQILGLLELRRRLHRRRGNAREDERNCPRPFSRQTVNGFVRRPAKNVLRTAPQTEHCDVLPLPTKTKAIGQNRKIGECHVSVAIEISRRPIPESAEVSG